jgi:ubiquinone/menaquinone biosynthesis C-methylase UbiE
MKIEDATVLLRNASFNISTPQSWLDLGCGTGTFTFALTNLLPQGSRIYAVDKIAYKLDSAEEDTVHVKFMMSDFETVEFEVNEKIDGVLMGNSLHYIRNKRAFLNRILNRFPSIQQMIIIEYDTQKANQWVPYPITFLELKRLMQDTGFKQVHKIAQRPSIYGQGDMYVADITAFAS